MPIAQLTDRALLRVTGEDAASFLQGMITQDMRKLQTQTAIYAMLLSPQGKYLFDFFVVKDGEGFLIDCRKEDRDTLIQRLSMYKLRAKVQLTPEDNLFVFATWGNAEAHNGLAYADPRLEGMGIRCISDKADATLLAEDYHAHRIALGVPEGDMIRERSFPMYFGMEDLHGVDFAKGCYTGQEVTARMKHRGEMRKFLHQVKSDAVLVAGAEIEQNSKPLEKITSASGNTGLVLLPLDNTLDGLSVNGSPVTAHLPPWARSLQKDLLPT